MVVRTGQIPLGSGFSGSPVRKYEANSSPNGSFSVRDQQKLNLTPRLPCRTAPFLTWSPPIQKAAGEVNVWSLYSQSRTLAEAWAVLGIANALSKPASVTNGPVSPADATIQKAKSDQMNRIRTKQVSAVAEQNESVGAFVTIRLRHVVGRRLRGGKSAGRSLAHARYVKAQVMAARSEAVWTPITTE
jgi:hypothetical protein